MYQDVDVSKTLIDQYRTYCENKGLNDISMNYLKHNNFKALFFMIIFS